MFLKRKRTYRKTPPGGSVSPVNHFASARQDKKRLLTVMTYNVKNCDDGEKIAEIAEDIQKYKPDAVCIQEIDLNVPRSGNRDILKELAEMLQMNYCFFPSIALQGGQYGLGILCTYPLEHCSSQPLEVRKGDEERILASAEITVNGQAIQLYNTHLSFEDTQTRLRQIRAVDAIIGQNAPFILAGDFNAESFQEFSCLNGVHAANVAEMPYQTYIGEDADTVFRAIDNIFVSENFKLKEVVFGITTVSDHRPLTAGICL